MIAVMPAWFLVYAGLMALMLVVNAVGAVVMRCRWWCVPYELAVGAYFLGFAALSWQSGLHCLLEPWLHVPLFVLLLVVECCIAVSSRPEDFAADLPAGVGPAEMDAAKAIAAVAMMPAYVVGAMLCAVLAGGG